MAEKKEKLTKVELKLKRHPRKAMRLGRHIVKMGKFQEFELNDEELKELNSKGGKHWFINKKDFDKKQKELAEKAKK